MSSNKMGGVPSQTRDALYKMLEKVDINTDAQWAEAILALKEIGPKEALARMSKH